MKRIMVLAGGNDQAALIQEIRRKFNQVYIILIDMNPNVVAGKYADKQLVISTMDESVVRQAAVNEHVDYILTACGDQPLLTMASVSENLGLPCYLSKSQVLTLTNKKYMKELMLKNDIPTSKYKIFNNLEEIQDDDLKYPLMVKPVDSNGSKGVRKVSNKTELNVYAQQAFKYSLTDTIIVEEFNEGIELSCDFYVSENEVKKIMFCQLNKFSVDESTSIIYQSIIPPNISESVNLKICNIARKIANGYRITNSPLLIQVIYNGNDVKVIEFSARLGGGAKYKTIQNVTSWNVLRANLDSMLGEYPNIDIHNDDKYYSRCHLYLKGGVFNKIVGLDDLINNGIIDEYIITKSYGTRVNKPKASSDRVASIFISSKDRKELNCKVLKAIQYIQVYNENDIDILERDMYLN